MNIENLTVTDNGETITVSYIVSDGNMGACVNNQQIFKNDIYLHNPLLYMDKIDDAIEGYLKQNLKLK